MVYSFKFRYTECLTHHISFMCRKNDDIVQAILKKPWKTKIFLISHLTIKTFFHKIEIVHFLNMSVIRFLTFCGILDSIVKVLNSLK